MYEQRSNDGKTFDFMLPPSHVFFYAYRIRFELLPKCKLKMLQVKVKTPIQSINLIKMKLLLLDFIDLSLVL